MSGRRLSSRNLVGTESKRKRSTSRNVARSERSKTGMLILFLLVLLILIVVLPQVRVSASQAILLGIVLLVLSIGLVGLCLLRRKRAYAPVETVSRAREAVVRAPVLAWRASQPATVADLLRLTPGEFEAFVGDLLEITGWCSDVCRVGGAGDRGADLVARDRFGRPFIVQCKRYAGRKVSAGEMRDFLGAKGIYGADEGLFVTTAKFTDAARANMAHSRQNVFLLDGENLVQIVRENWDKLPDRWHQSLLERRASVE